ncbi:MAG TPA: hypothetical protein VGB63_13155 [Pedobacter sp.]|jgi:hypothetical protein
MKFSYQAGFPDDPWLMEVSVINNAGSPLASVYKNGKLIMQLSRGAFGWGQSGRMKLDEDEPAAIRVKARIEFAWDEVCAVTDEIENEFEKAQKNPNKSGFEFGK